MLTSYYLQLKDFLDPCCQFLLWSLEHTNDVMLQGSSDALLSLLRQWAHIVILMQLSEMVITAPRKQL